MKIIRGKLSLAALAVASVLSATIVPLAHADNSTGSIFGNAQQGATISIENKDTGLKRQITVDTSGRYNFSQLPTGRYKVTVGSETREINVNIGTGTPVNFAAGDVENIIVSGARINPIDVSSVESTTVITAEQIARLPVSRDISAVALLAPGTVKGDDGIGDGSLASFGGSSVAENGYYINGFDVTNIRNFTSYATLPFDAIAQQQIKTGGYGAEYGRSLGGVISLVTKRGTNEWQGGFSTYWSPDSLAEKSKKVLSRNPKDLTTNNQYFVYHSDDTDDQLTYNIYGGGPIIEDKLFIFGLVEGRNNKENIYERAESTRIERNQPRYLLRADWYITDSNIIDITAIDNRSVRDITTYINEPGSYYSGKHEQQTNVYERRDGGQVLIGKYTGQLTDDLTLSLMSGTLDNENNYRIPNSLPGGDCPRVFDSRNNPGVTDYIGCWNPSQDQIRDPNFGPDEDKRQAYRLDIEYSLGDHSLRFGYDDETFESSKAGDNLFSGGEYWRLYRTGNTTRRVNGVTVAPNTQYARRWIDEDASGRYEIHNSAAYLEDTWQVTRDLMLYAGLRSESFENLNGTGDTFVDAKHLIAPRLGASWDVKGDSSMKVFGNLGRYHIPVAANTNIRAAGWEVREEQYFYHDGIDPTTAAPINRGAQIGPTNINGSRQAPEPGTVAATNLDPMYQDELIAGFQMSLSESLSAGVRGIYRKAKNGMDDYCGHDAFAEFAKDNGHENFNTDSLADCVILNPGRDLELQMDLNDDGTLQNVTIPKSYLGLPSYERSYKALEIFWERTPMDDGWYIQGSYTWSKNEGNVEGYVNSTLEQEDAGLTQDFDHKLFEDGANGPLPNDRRHSIKLFGGYEFSKEWRVSGNVLVQSGRPLSCVGYIPLDQLDPNGTDAAGFRNYGASSFYCTNEQGIPTLGQRGSEGRTPWTYNFDFGASYQPDWAGSNLTLKMDIFNLFNLQKVTQYYEVGDYQDGSRDNIIRNPNYGNVLNYQSPRSVRFALNYTF